MVSVNFADPSNDLVYQLPNRLVDDYTQEVYERNRSMLESSHNFLFDKNKAFQDELNAQEKKRIDLETLHPGVTSEQHQQIVWVEQRIAADEEAVRRLLAIAEAHVLAIQKTKDITAETPLSQPVEIEKGPNPEKERLGAERQKYKEELDLALTLRCMTRDHPAVKTLQERINIMEQRIRETPDEIELRKVYSMGGGGEIYTARLAAAQAEVEILKAEYDRVQTQVAGYAKMQQDLDIARKEYVGCLERMDAIKVEAKSWQDRLRQVEMALAAEDNKLRMKTETIQKAQKPILPSSPRLAIVLGVSLGGAVLLGALMVFGFHRKDRSIASGQVAESFLGLPVYGVISEATPAWRRAGRSVLKLAMAVVLLAAVGASAWMLYLRVQQPDQWRGTFKKCGPSIHRLGEPKA